MRRVGTRTKFAVFATAAVALTSGILLPNLASAGTNGQQIRLCGNNVGGTASISGKNQGGVQTALSDIEFNPIGCNEIRDYWWVGEVTINFTTYPDLRTGAQSRTDSTTCQVPRDNGALPDTAGSFVDCTIS